MAIINVIFIENLINSQSTTGMASALDIRVGKHKILRIACVENFHFRARRVNRAEYNQQEINRAPGNSAQC